MKYKYYDRYDVEEWLQKHKYKYESEETHFYIYLKHSNYCVSIGGLQCTDIDKVFKEFEDRGKSLEAEDEIKVKYEKRKIKK